ncbi:MAG: thioredoxin domain-containing protein [Candidatus Paceibacterota bacterium]|jgi:protein-disulfide isomerase
MTSEQSKVYYVPAAILLAGFIIAGAIYLTGKDSSPSQNTNQPVKKQVASGISIKTIDSSDHIKGNPNANVAILEYSDTECPFCKRFHTTMQSIIDQYGKDGKVAWVYRHFPLDSIHPKTRKEAEATECANELAGNTGFWNMIDKIYTNTPSNNQMDPSLLPVFAKAIGLDQAKFNTCLSSGKYAATVEAQYQDGLKAGAQGTPYSLIVLRKALTSPVEKSINDLVVKSGLSQNISITSDKTKIVLNGALPLQAITPILDILVK